VVYIVLGSDRVISCLKGVSVRSYIALFREEDERKKREEKKIDLITAHQSATRGTPIAIL
jgi:hypothetical protein